MSNTIVAAAAQPAEAVEPVPAYSWYALAALAYPLFFPSSGVPLLSYPRFTLTAFPLYIALAVFTRGRPKTHAALVIVGIVTLVLLTAKFAVFSWVA